MNLTFSSEETIFREEVRNWLEEHRPREALPPPGPERLAFEKAWQSKLYQAGWAGLSWPAEFGGRGFSLMKQLIWFEEAARVGAPPEGIFFVALNHAGPTLMICGTDAQKTRFLPPILRGETPWCQGFSEPNAGSDLAAIQTRGVVDGDEMVISGSKIWTTGAEQSDYQELLIRTDPASRRHAGLTWIIGEMDRPGVAIRPIRALDGEVHFCEVFYDGVRLPLSNVVGRMNDGWKVAMTTLGIERGTAAMRERLEIGRIVEQLIEIARSTADSGGRPVIEAGDVADRLAMARAEAAALRAMSYRTISRASREAAPGAEGVMAAVYATELVQRVHQLAMDIMGVRSLDRDAGDHWPQRYLASRLRTLAGGTAQIRRNIIGERFLGLPRGS